MKAKITLRNILAVLQAYYRKGKNIAGFNLPNHVYEQVLWRRTEVIKKSKKCWDSGSCIVCGCDILGKTMEDRGCSVAEDKELMLKGKRPCYPAMMNRKEWKKYKELHDIKLFN